MSMLSSPFTSRLALDAWESANCARCTRAWTEDDGYRCPIQLALRCSCTDPIAAEIAARMGYATPAGLRPRDGVWPCREAIRGGFLAPIGYPRFEEVCSWASRRFLGGIAGSPARSGAGPS